MYRLRGSLIRYKRFTLQGHEYDDNPRDIVDKTISYFASRSFFDSTNPEYWILLQSQCSSGLHIPLFDFDDKVDVIARTKEANLSGHVYSTGHGYHFIVDGYMRLKDIEHRGTFMGVCPMFIELAMKNGYFGLRCGRKKDREYDDIKYLYHTSGLEVPKNYWLVVHDALCTRMSWLYNCWEDSN